MTTYEVHISRERGIVEERSIFLRTPDLELARHAVETWERTARRADDRHAWIRTAASSGDARATELRR